MIGNINYNLAESFYSRTFLQEGSRALQETLKKLKVLRGAYLSKFARSQILRDYIGYIVRAIAGTQSGENSSSRAPADIKRAIIDRNKSAMTVRRT